MALKLRRGTNAGRTAITPAEGEPIFTTDTKQLYIGDGTTAGGVAVGGGGVSDGDKGDITVSGGGTVWTIDAGAVVEADIATNAVTNTKIANDAVTYAKIQNVSTNSRLLGRASAGAGDIEEITIGSGLSLTGTTLSASGGGGGGDIPTFMVVKSADETVLNSTAAQFDDHLFYSAPAFNRHYYFEATIYVERSITGGGGDQPGIKFAFGNDSNIQGLFNCIPLFPSQTVWVYGAFTANSTVDYTTAISHPIAFKIQGTFRPLSGNANLRFVWAQSTASSTIGTVVKKGSKLLVWDLTL